MHRMRVGLWGKLILGTALVLSVRVSSPAATSPAADTQNKKVVLGGPHGMVRNAKGYPIEGMMVQLISEKSSIRTTVYTNDLGQYEFPKLPAGVYMLRTPRALEYRRYEKDAVRVDGANKLDDIVMERVSESEFLPPTPEIISQLSDAEWLYNISGTGQEKRIFSNTCGTGCHSYQMQMRSRFDERSWRLIVHRMLDYGGRILVEPRDGRANADDDAGSRGTGDPHQMARQSSRPRFPGRPIQGVPSSARPGHTGYHHRIRVAVGGSSSP